MSNVGGCSQSHINSSVVGVQTIMGFPACQFIYMHPIPELTLSPLPAPQKIAALFWLAASMLSYQCFLLSAAESY
jgi:hypothetical protein